MPAILGFIGWHNSGKTTIIRAIASLLQKRGYKVAVLKATEKSGLCLDKEGSDTALYWQDGIEWVGMLAPDQILIRNRPVQLDIQTFAARFFAEADLLLVEGCKYADIAKVEVRRKKSDPSLHRQVSGVIAVISEQANADDPLLFQPHQHMELTQFIEQRLLLVSAE